ncbi:MAG: Rrf2 family transcriptional regulator, partial [Syntrophorhabdus sp.]
MFQLSRKAEYAIRAMLCLAEKPVDTISSLNQIASSAEASHTFLAKILQQLGREGMVRSMRGAAGGFQLGRAARDINLLEIIETIEGPMYMNRCIMRAGLCERDTTCPVHPVWKAVQERMKNVMQDITLEYLV